MSKQLERELVKPLLLARPRHQVAELALTPDEQAKLARWNATIAAFEGTGASHEDALRMAVIAGVEAPAIKLAVELDYEAYDYASLAARLNVEPALSPVSEIPVLLEDGTPTDTEFPWGKYTFLLDLEIQPYSVDTTEYEVSEEFGREVVNAVESRERQLRSDTSHARVYVEGSAALQMWREGAIGAESAHSIAGYVSRCREAHYKELRARLQEQVDAIGRLLMEKYNMDGTSAVQNVAKQAVTGRLSEHQIRQRDLLQRLSVQSGRTESLSDCAAYLAAKGLTGAKGETFKRLISVSAVCQFLNEQLAIG